MDMVDREADNSDSLEVWGAVKVISVAGIDTFITGIHATALNCWWYWIWFGLVST